MPVRMNVARGVRRHRRHVLRFGKYGGLNAAELPIVGFRGMVRAEDTQEIDEAR